jgi:hypothetical protein
MSDPRKFKNNVVVEGELVLPNESASKALSINASGEITSSVTTDAELEFVSGVTSSIQTQLTTAQNAIDNHIADAVDAHDASAISNIPSGNLAATDIQGAVDELQSDIDTRALDSEVIKKDGSVTYTGAQSMGGFKITSLASPTASSDAATKEYVDNALEGLRPKEAVKAASTANIDLATGTLLTVDGIALSAGDRVLVKSQTLPEENGIYIAASGAWTRSTDFDSISPIDEINKAFVAVQEGTLNQGKIFIQFGVVTTLGTDAINFTFFNSVSGLTGDDGITVSGSSISVDQDGQGLQFIAGQLALELDGATLSKSASGIKLSDTVVTPGSYGSATEVSAITVDQQGRLTSSASTAIAIPSTQVTDFDEAAQDTVGGILANSDTVNLTYNDATPSVVADVKTQLSIDSDASGIKLVNDAASPGNTQYYGTNGSGTKGFYPIPAVGSAGDIQETSFSLANNQVAAADVTGFAFAAGVVRSFSALVSVEIDATADLYEQVDIQGINKAGSFNISVDSVGDDSGIVFSITSAGQIQYTSTNNAGFVTGLIKFRALTTTV